MNLMQPVHRFLPADSMGEKKEAPIGIVAGPDGDAGEKGDDGRFHGVLKEDGGFETFFLQVGT